MSGNKNLLLLAAAVLVVAASACTNEMFPARGIRFTAKSKGYISKTKAPLTKTAYTGSTYTDPLDAEKDIERIDWVDGDVIRIASDYAYVLGNTSKHYSDFRVKSHTGSGAESTATITPSSDPNSLQWDKNYSENTFWGMYPTPSGGNTFTNGTMVFTMPTTQSKTLDMSIAPMLATATSSTSASSVSLPFTPQFNAFEFTIDKGAYTTVALTQFTLTAASGNLAGTYTVAAGSYAAVASVTGGSSTITIDLTGTTLNADNPSLTLTVFTIPETFNSGLTIAYTGSFDGGASTTRTLTLKYAGGSVVQFAPYKKYIISGLSFPVILGATIDDSISWDFSLQIMDGVVWWIGAEAVNNIDWIDDLDFDAYTELRDEVKWFSGAHIEQDFAWEELDHIALSSDADMYLWRTETAQRTVTAVNRSGNIFSDVSASWSCSPAYGVIYLNQSTGEIRAVAPGEATVTATVTPNDGSTPYTLSYKVYVNAPTGITLTAAQDFVRPDDTVDLTAAVTCTSNGTPTAYPADLLEWSSVNTGIITVEGTQPAIATGQAAATATGTATEGTSTLTVSVATKYADGITASLTDFPCEDRTTITITAPGEKYKFRDKYLYPGILKYESSAYGVTGELDGLASVMAAFGTAAGRAKHYFSWTDLSTAFTTTSGTITGTVYNDGVNTWRIPTQSEWDTIINTAPTSTTKVGSTTLSKGFAQIVINLTGSTLAGQGLTTYEMGGSAGVADGGAVSRTNYIAGLLLIPDGATVSCPRMKGTVGAAASWSVSTNCITYDDLEILVTGGCVFLPAAGYYYGSSWSDGGGGGYHWSATQYSSWTANAYYLYFYSSSVSATNYNFKSNNYQPVRLVRN